jgi:tRNA A37 threonylcarbamoyladenosine biosynthesis protein TsaE
LLEILFSLVRIEKALSDSFLNDLTSRDFIIKDLAALERFSSNFAEFLKSSLKEGKNSGNGVVQGPAQDIFLLFKGGLAAGKTTTISAIIKALGVISESTSPTFMGMHEYSFSLNNEDLSSSRSEPCRNIQFYHLDLYQKNIDLDSVLELMDSDSPQIWMLEWSEKLDQEILDYLYLKHAYIKTFDIELKILEDDARKLAIRETFQVSCDFNKKEIDENIGSEVLKWFQQELN